METLSKFLCVPMEIQHAQSICSWRYPQPYHIYNWPDWPNMEANGFEFGDPQIRSEQYSSILDQDQNLIGFAQFFPMVGVTRLGFSLHPDRCGCGYGAKFVRLIAEEATRRAPEKEVDLEVLTWNIRAYKAYKNAGFVHTDTYERPTSNGIQVFHCMVYKG